MRILLRPALPAALASAVSAAALAPAVLCAAPPPSTPSPAPTVEEQLRARYTKFEYRIPMRDGVKLLTAVYVPKDAEEGGKTFPILLHRTPYGVGPYGPDRYPKSLGPSELFWKAGYVFAEQDVRGRMMSEGEFVNVRPILTKRGPRDADDATDAYDTVDWLVKNVPGNNGKVGTWGISYPGYYAAVALVGAHPALSAVSPQAPIADWFEGDDFRHRGAFFLPHAFGFFSTFGVGRTGPTKKTEKWFEYDTPDGYRWFLKLPPLSEVNGKLLGGKAPFWDELVSHSTYDAFWKARDLRPHLAGPIRPAVLTVGGWFDAENLFGALSVYGAIEKQGPGVRNALVMGPWVHGGWGRTDGDALGPVSFGGKTSLWYRENVELPFFERHLRGKPEEEPAEATVFETGTNRWRRFDSWPPKGTESRALYLREGGELSWVPPRSAGEDAFDEYLSDPARPVPFTARVSTRMVAEYMVEDQRFASTRPDVLVYETPVLEKDLALAGPITADLWVSTTGTDADWVVKLVDVYPEDLPDAGDEKPPVRMGGYQQLVRAEVIRGRFRDSLEKPEPFAPGVPARVRLTLNDVAHVFRSGHRVMVQVQSSWFPLVDRNPQTFVEIATAKPSDYRKATHRVHRSGAKPSKVVLTVLPERP